MSDPNTIPFTLFWLSVLALYFLPSIVAIFRKVENAGPTVIVNFFFGWTFIGWVVALAMGAGAKTREPLVERRAAPTAAMKTCPECAEQVQATATICRYCRHEFAEPVGF